MYFWQAARRAARDARAASLRFELLQSIAPALTAASLESASSTCKRILERLDALVPSATRLCFVARDGRLELGASAGTGYAGFLRTGSSYAGNTIVDWTFERGVAAIVGPRSAEVPADVKIADLTRDDPGVGPAAGSRDRVWAAAVPLALDHGVRSRPDVVGVLYVERPRGLPFAPDDLRTLVTVARLAADALSRALFADAVRRDSSIDGLTGLLTPGAFRDRLRREVASGRDVALFFIDTDRFKLLNDTHGHAAGDRLLRALAAKFAAIAATGSGFAGRNGGDEFCIALPDRTKDMAVEIAEHVRAAIEAEDLGRNALGDGRPNVRITVSIGVAHVPVDVTRGDRQPAERLLEIADEQMYEAKRAGRNRVAFARASPVGEREMEL